MNVKNKYVYFDNWADCLIVGTAQEAVESKSKEIYKIGERVNLSVDVKETAYTKPKKHKK